MAEETVMKAKRVYIANNYKRGTGVFNILESYRRVLLDFSIDVKWLQFTEAGSKPPTEFSDGTIRGLDRHPYKVLNFINRLIVFPYRGPKELEGILILSNPWLLPLSKNNKHSILVVHDIRALTRYRGHYLESLLYRHMMRYLKNIDKFIVLSEFTKTGILSLGVPEEKVNIIYPGIEQKSTESMLKGEKAPLATEGKFIVTYVANDLPYKNIRLFIRIAESFMNSPHKEYFKFLLISNVRRETSDLIERLELRNVVVKSSVSNMEEVYKFSDLYVSTSEYEGFGLPILEAMSYGIPVIANDIPPHAEILGESGVLIKDNNFDYWLVEISRMVDTEHYREVSRYLEKRLKLFSTAKFKDEVIKCIENFI